MPELESPAMGLPFELATAPIEIFVFQANISGVIWYVAAESTGAGEFHLIDRNTVPGVVINSALAEADLTGLAEVTVCGADYPLEISVTFPANDLVLKGMGRQTLLDGDALATNVHAIVLSGYTDCVVKDLAVQTEDGGGKTCHCIYIDQGAHGFLIEHVIIVASDAHGIYLTETEVIAPTGLTEGKILACNFIQTDLDAVHSEMTPSTEFLDELTIALCYFYEDVGQDAISLDNTTWCNITKNKGWAVGRHYIYLRATDMWNWNDNIEGNQSDYNGPGHQIYLDFCQYCNVVNNTVSYAGTGPIPMDGIHLNDSSWNVIAENHVLGSQRDGIHLEGDSDDNLMEGNWLFDTINYGINISAATCNNNRVGENKILFVGVGRINDAGTDTELPEITVVVSDPDGNIGTHPCIVLTDGVDITARFEIQFPSHFQEMVRARIILVPGGTGNLRRSASSNLGKICSGENYNQHTDSIAAGEVAVTINDLACIDVAAALNLALAGDLVGLEFTRHGSHANDTVNANCYLLAFNMQYV